MSLTVKKNPKYARVDNSEEIKKIYIKFIIRSNSAVQK